MTHTACTDLPWSQIFNSRSIRGHLNRQTHGVAQRSSVRREFGNAAYTFQALRLHHTWDVDDGMEAPPEKVWALHCTPSHQKGVAPYRGAGKSWQLSDISTPSLMRSQRKTGHPLQQFLFRPLQVVAAAIPLCAAAHVSASRMEAAKWEMLVATATMSIPLDSLVFEETGELLAVLLPHVRRSLEVAQIEAPDIIVMLEGRVGSTKAPNVDHMLLRTLRRMPLSALLGLIMVRDDFRPFLEEQVEVLRCRLG
eukprot:s2268_g4.t1